MLLQEEEFFNIKPLKVNKLGPYRVWHPHTDSPGLAMSRSIGDCMIHDFGVISEPEILEYSITSEDKFIVLASDGVWEFLSNQDVVNSVATGILNNDLNRSAKLLLGKAYQKWNSLNSSIDDITCIVIKLNQ